MALSRASLIREGGGEASAGVVWAGLLSRVISVSPGCRRSSKPAEGHVAGSGIASSRRTLRGQRTWARTNLSMRENREVPWSPVLLGRAARGTPTAVSP